MAVGKVLYKGLYWKILQFLTSFIINIILTRSFQSIISAEFYAMVYILSLGISFFTLGLDISLNYYLSRKEISPAMAGRIIVFIVVLALLVCLPLLYLFYQPSRYPDLRLSQLLLFSAFNITGGLLTTLSGTLFTAYGRNYLPAMISFIANLIVIVLSLGINSMSSGSAVVGSLFQVYFLFSFLQGGFLFLLSMRLYAGRGQSGDGDNGRVGAMELLRYSFSAFVINFIFFAGARLGVYLLPYRVSPADQGNYIQAYKIVEYMGVLISVIYYPFIALVAGEDREKMKERVLFLVRLSNTLVLLAGVFILACGWWLFPLVFGRSFDRMYEIFIGFLPGLFAVCSSTFFTAYYFGSGRLKYNLISACIQFAGLPAFFFLFVHNGNVMGAAFAFSLSVLGSLGYDMLVFRRSFPYSLRDILLIRAADVSRITGLVRQGSGFRFFFKER
jgi:O-antigen/teichoic acid export membrane protein